MNLKELKRMITEEYHNYMSEQPAPEVAVSDMDVDAMGGDIDAMGGDIDAMGGGEDPEKTLRDIYEMLKAYFEGGEDMTGDDMVDDDEDTDIEDSETPEDAALQERFQKLANIIKG